MALFSRSKKKENDTSAPVAAVGTPRDLSHVLRSPRITEKASLVQSHGVYVFDIAPAVTKQDVARAVEKHFKVKPRAVRIVKSADKATRNARTGKRGIVRGGRKAYVYLRKGETITLA